MTTWGKEIAVNGVRPKWLVDDDRVKLNYDTRHANVWSLDRRADSMESGWGCVKLIRLPADAWQYRALDAGFTPWSGGDAAPEDWDGGEVLVRDMCDATRTIEPMSWRVWLPAAHPEKGVATTVIGYRKRVEQPAEDPDYVRVKRMTESEALATVRAVCDFSWKDPMLVLRKLGLIRDDTPLDRFMSTHPTADRETAELVMKWRDGE